MNHLKIRLIIVLAFTYFSIACPQEISRPNSAMKSPETLEITSIEFSGGKTIVNMTVENRIQGGYFCADRNIFIIDQSGNRLKLLKALNIPTCPKSYNFRSIGEKLSFSLEFPPLNPGTGWIDIVEECNDNCFWFYGITLDPQLNKRLDDVFAIASSGKPEENILLFRKMLEEIDSSNRGI